MKPFVVSLSNHEWLRAFDKLRPNGVTPLFVPDQYFPGFRGIPYQELFGDIDLGLGAQAVN